MTIPRLKAMHAYWDICPPVHIGLNRLNSALLKPTEGSQKQIAASSGGFQKGQNLDLLIAEFGAAGGDVKL